MVRLFRRWGWREVETGKKRRYITMCRIKLHHKCHESGMLKVLCKTQHLSSPSSWSSLWRSAREHDSVLQDKASPKPSRKGHVEDTMQDAAPVDSSFVEFLLETSKKRRLRDGK